MIYERVEPGDLVLDMRELSARLGYPVDSLTHNIKDLYESLKMFATPAYCAVYANITRQNEAIIIGNARTVSKALNKVFDGSNECILLAATLGVGVDRLILKTAGRSAHDAFVIDALADAMIESLCDRAQMSLCTDISTQPRFSPGYADLPLSFGKEILLLTDAERTLGIKLSESGMMLPKKSVNAIIAINR